LLRAAPAATNWDRIAFDIGTFDVWDGGAVVGGTVADVDDDTVGCVVERGDATEVVVAVPPREAPEQPAMDNDDATKIAPSDSRPSSLWIDLNLRDLHRATNDVHGRQNRTCTDGSDEGSPARVEVGPEPASAAVKQPRE